MLVTKIEVVVHDGELQNFSYSLVFEVFIQVTVTGQGGGRVRHQQ